MLRMLWKTIKRALEVGGDIAARIIAPLSEELDTRESVVKDGKVIYSEPLKEALKALFQLLRQTTT